MAILFNNPLLQREFGNDPIAQRKAEQRAEADAILDAHDRGSATADRLEQREDVFAGLEWVLRVFGPTTVVAIKPDGPIDAKWLDGETIETTAIWASQINQDQAGWNLYFCPNLPVTGLPKKPSKAEIAVLRAAAYADIDAKDGQTIEGAREALHRLPLPDVVIASGGGFQPIWLLPTPISAGPDANARVEARSKRVTAAEGGDYVGSIEHILRLPFTRNYPNAKKRAAGRGISVAGLLHLGPVASEPHYTEAELDKALDGCRVAPSASKIAGIGASVLKFPVRIPAVFANRTDLPDLNAAAQAGLPPRHWFDRLPCEQKNDLLRQIFALPNVLAAADSGRDEWLRLLFGAAHAEHLGATKARKIAEDWSRTSDKFDQTDFERSWASFNVGRV